MNMDTISFLEHQTSYYNTMSLPNIKNRSLKYHRSDNFFSNSQNYW